MATRRFDVNREQSLALISAGNAGNGNDDHCPNGKSSFNSTITFRTLLRFAHDWSGMTKVTSIRLYMRKTGGVHTDQGSGASAQVQRCGDGSAGAWSSGGGSENNWSTSASGEKWPGPATGTTSQGSVTGTGWQSIEIIDSYWGMVPASVELPTSVVGSGHGGGEDNNGIRVKATNEGTVSDSFEFYGQSSSYPPYLIVTYESNRVPNKPTITSPTPGQVFGPGTTVVPVSFTGSDPDAGDTMQKWGYSWGAGPTVGTVTDLSTASGFNVTGHPLNPVGAANMPGADTISVRTYDQDGAVSPYSTAVSVIFSDGPSVASPLPAGGALADIHNAAELAVWDATARAKPIVKFTYQHTAGRNMAGYRVRLYSDALAVLWDSGTVAKSAAPGTVTTVNVPTAIVNGTQYRWGVEVLDVDGFWSPAMTPTTFKVRWGQAIYAENITTSGKDFAFTATPPALGKVQFLYQLADDAAGTGGTAWSTALPTQLASPKAYLRVLVRLWATVAGQNPALPDMQLTYNKGAAMLPDRWQNASPANASLSLDQSVRRFSRQSLRVRTLTTASHMLYPYRKTIGDGIDVVPGTDYAYSVYIRTNGPLAGGAIVRIGIRNQAGTAYIVTLQPCDPDYGAIQTNDSSGHPDGWQRLAGWFTVPDGTTLIQPDIWCNGVSVGNEYWIDGAKLEEGRVASTWVPGLVGAATHDRAGLQIDAQLGGIFRLRSSGGVITEMGAAGLTQDGSAFSLASHTHAPTTIAGAATRNLGTNLSAPAINTTAAILLGAPSAGEDPLGFYNAGKVTIPAGLGGVYIFDVYVQGTAPAGTASATLAYAVLRANFTNPASATELLGRWDRYDSGHVQGGHFTLVRPFVAGETIDLEVTMRIAAGTNIRTAGWSMQRIATGYA